MRCGISAGGVFEGTSWLVAPKMLMQPAARLDVQRTGTRQMLYCPVSKAKVRFEIRAALQMAYSGVISEDNIRIQDGLAAGISPE